MNSWNIRSLRLRSVRFAIMVSVFLATFLWSCATGEVEATPKIPDNAWLDPQANTQDAGNNHLWPILPKFDAGGSHDVSSDVDGAVSKSDVYTLADASIATGPDVYASIDATMMPSFDASTTSSLDVGPPMRDVPMPPSLDGGTRSLDVPLPTPDVGATHDVTSPPDVTASSDVPIRRVEICNGLDDDGNGFVDEIFECSVGRRGGTCITSCGANGYQLCTNLCRWATACQSYPEDCSDTIDNDCNGLIDCRDPACTSLALCARMPVDSGTVSLDASHPVVDSGVVDALSPSMDAGSVSACPTLIVRLDSGRLAACSSGWVAILYDSEGHPHEGVAGGMLTFAICGRLRGSLVLSARCAGDYLLDWPGVAGQPINTGGVASLALDGRELADGEAIFCRDVWSPTPGVRPSIPLEPFYEGRCP